MDPKLQRRVQRYGWDLAAAHYEALWQAQLAAAQRALIARAELVAGEHVLDLACGSGLVAMAAARAVGAGGRVLGVDLSGRMVVAAREAAAVQRLSNLGFERMDGEALALADASFDVALSGLGLMYMPEPRQALHELQRVLRPGGRIALAVWGERAHCGWASVFEIVDAEVESEVCPLFFDLGRRDRLARLVSEAGFDAVDEQRITMTLDYPDGDEACRAAFIGGPVALAWSRFDAPARERVCARYLASIERWRCDGGYRVPAEFVVVAATARRRSTSMATPPSMSTMLAGSGTT